MTKKQTVYWNSPGDIEVFIPIIEKQLPNISVEKKGTLAEFIEATQ